jgi:hypothetical protein
MLKYGGSRSEEDGIPLEKVPASRLGGEKWN